MDRIGGRRERLRESIKAAGADVLLVSSTTNVSYLTGFTGDSSVLLVGLDCDVLISDGRFTTQIEQECPGLAAVIRPTGQELTAAVALEVGSRGFKKVAFESTSLTHAEYQALRDAMPTAEVMGVIGLVEGLRRIKDEGEIEEIRESIAIAEKAFAALRAGIREGQTEKEVADALEGHMRHLGATAASFPPIVAVGKRAALPHARPTKEGKIGDDDFVLIDWGASGRPYKSDLTRVVVTGKVTRTFETIYQTVLAAQERGISAIRPGAKASDVDGAARSVIEAAGYGSNFEHGLGHGLGMDIHEAPRLRKGSDETLEPGMVVTVEPGIYLPDWGGIRIEDDVLVTRDGCEVLSHVAKTLDSVRMG